MKINQSCPIKCLDYDRENGGREQKKTEAVSQEIYPKMNNKV